MKKMLICIVSAATLTLISTSLIAFFVLINAHKIHISPNFPICDVHSFCFVYLLLFNCYLLSLSCLPQYEYSAKFQIYSTPIFLKFIPLASFFLFYLMFFSQPVIDLHFIYYSSVVSHQPDRCELQQKV